MICQPGRLIKSSLLGNQGQNLRGRGHPAGVAAADDPGRGSDRYRSTVMYGTPSSDGPARPRGRPGSCDGEPRRTGYSGAPHRHCDWPIRSRVTQLYDTVRSRVSVGGRYPAAAVRRRYRTVVRRGGRAAPYGGRAAAPAGATR
eukprot:716811-Hanusia_phi.AAC.1